MAGTNDYYFLRLNLSIQHNISFVVVRWYDILYFIYDTAIYHPAPKELACLAAQI
jgi:hypothetical protein